MQYQILDENGGVINTIDGALMPMRLTEAERDAILLADIGAHEAYRP